MKLLKCLKMLLIILFCVPPMWANHWPQFRGPHGNQLSQDKQLPQVWNHDKNIKWQVKIPGRARSSPVVWGHRVFITTAVLDEPSKSYTDIMESSTQSLSRSAARNRIQPNADHRWEIYCLDKDSGKILWVQVASQGKPTMITHSENSYASETPVTDGK